MDYKEVLAEMARDQESTPTACADFFAAFRDLVVERLVKKETVNLTGFGTFEVVNGAERPYRFRFAKELCSRLGINSKINVAACIKCGQHPPLPGRRKCRNCMHAEQRARRAAKRKTK